MRLAVLAEHMTDTITVLLEHACYCLLHQQLTAGTRTQATQLGMAVEATQFTRCYLQGQPFRKRETLSAVYIHLYQYSVKPAQQVQDLALLSLPLPEAMSPIVFLMALLVGFKTNHETL